MSFFETILTPKRNCSTKKPRKEIKEEKTQRQILFRSTAKRARYISNFGKLNSLQANAFFLSKFHLNCLGF
jgi:hypothetical protein